MQFALAYHHIPELIKVREGYERLWGIAAAIAVLGCLTSTICFRLWTKRRVLRLSKIQNPIVAWVFIGGLAGAGLAVGWIFWFSGVLYTWGTQENSVGELTICSVNGAGWGSLLGQVLFLASIRPRTGVDRPLEKSL